MSSPIKTKYQINSNQNSNSPNEQIEGRHPWTSQEDEKLRILVEEFGIKKWTQIGSNMPG